MTTMRAARLIEPGKPLRIEEVPRPEPAPDEILVQVRACGLCGTDLHLAVEGTLPVERTPITLGHEAAGVVAGAGSSVSASKEGDRVALFPAAYCGQCRYCLAGRHSLCAASQVYGMSRDGSLAEYVVAPARCAIPLPDAIPFDVGAVVTDGIATPFHALRARAALRPAEAVGVFGCGGLGSHAIQLARLMGAAQIVAVDVERALQLGADLAINAKEDPKPARTVRRHLGSSGLDVALECIGLPQTVEQAVSCLGTGGRAVVVGVGPGRPTLPPLARLVGREQALIGSFGMDRADIEDLFGLIESGRLDVSASISARYALSEADSALKHLARRDGDVVRLVVEPYGAADG